MGRRTPFFETSGLTTSTTASTVFFAFLISAAGLPLFPTGSAVAAAALMQTEAPPAEAAQHLAILRDTTAERPVRDAAAEALIRLSHRPQVAQQIAEILQNDEQHDLRGPILRAISRTWNPPQRLFSPLVDLAARDVQRSTAVLPAIAAYATRDAAQVLIGYLSPETPSALRDAAASSLARMTGRDDLRSDPAAWVQWLDAARGLNELEWRDLLAEGLWRRADRLEGDRRAIGERLSEGFRRLYLATAAEDRSRLLSQMMLDSRPEVRDVGLEIVSRELAAGKAMEATVTDAAVRLLRSTDSRVRTRAAALVSQLGPTNSSAAIAEALNTERDPEAAAAMLQAISRAPDPAAADPMVRWLGRSETRLQAIDAALSLHRAGMLLDQSHRDAVLTVLQVTQPSRLSVSGVRLLALIGEDDDRNRLTGLVEFGTGPARVAAAEALAEYPQHVQLILAAAAQEPGIFPSAVLAVASWRNTVEGLVAISNLPASSTQEHQAGLLRVAASLPIVDLLTVASSSMTDLTLREALLARVVERPMGPFRPGEEEDLRTLAECILLLAETRLALKRPDRALAAIEALPPTWSGNDSPRTRRLRLIALVWTNRLSAAHEISAPAAAWLDALELAVAESHAPAILQEIRNRLVSNMSAEELQRLEMLAAQVPSPPAEGNGQPPQGSTPPVRTNEGG